MNKKQIICLLLSVLMVTALVAPVESFAEDMDFVDEFYAEEGYWDEAVNDYTEDDYSIEGFFDDQSQQYEPYGYVEGEYYDDTVSEFIETEPETVDVESEAIFFEDEFTEDDYFVEGFFDDQSQQYESYDYVEDDYYDHTAITEFTLDENEAYGSSNSFIIGQPQDYSGMVGTNATFTVEADSTDVTYQWQARKNSNSAWGATSMSGNRTNTLTVPILETRDGYQYRCLVTKGNVTLESDPATLSVVTFSIIGQPQDYSGMVGTNATFTVEADGTDVTYQWQARKNSNSAWGATSMSGSRTNTLTVPILETRDGYQYRCLVTKGNVTLESDPATLTVITDVILDGVTYAKLEDGTFAVVSYDGSASEIVIPSMVNGITVTKIGNDAFNGKANLTSISLPNSITVIGERAFKNCTNLSTMTSHN